MSDRFARVWFALFVLVIFCAGLAVGFDAGRRFDGRPVRTDAPLGGSGMGRGGPRPQVLLDRLTRQLDLTEPQREQIGAVLRASRDRVEALQRDTRAEFDREQRTLHDEIRRVLTPEQQERFNRSLPAGRRGGRGPGRGPGQGR